MSPGEQGPASLLRIDSSAPPCSAGLARATFLLCFPPVRTTAHALTQGCSSLANQGVGKPNHSHAAAGKAPAEVSKPRWRPRGPAHSHSARRPSPEPCRVQPGGTCRGSRYLDSSGKAPTAFWSEELEKAGERVRPQPPTQPWACRRTRATQARRPGLELLQPTAAGLPGATVGAGGSEGFCLGEQPGREPPGERTAST